MLNSTPLILRTPIIFDDQRYVLVYDKDLASYNLAYPFDGERDSFLFSPGVMSPARVQALNTASRSVGRVTALREDGVHASTGFFIADKNYILSSPDILTSPSVPILTSFNPADYPFVFHYTPSAQLDTGLRRANDNKKIDITLVQLTRNLALFKTTGAATGVPLVITKAALQFPAEACIMGYPGPLSMEEALTHYNSMSSEDKAIIPPPTVRQLGEFPANQKACFPGKITAADASSEFILHTSCSAWHGCSGGPVFAWFGDTLKIVAVVYGGSDSKNHNTLISCGAPEFMEMLMKCN